MLTVACVWRKSEIYDNREWVDRLWSMVDRHLSIPHKFVCITDEDVQGAVKPLIKHDKKPWWDKLNLFFLPGDRILYLDLDVVVQGDLSLLAIFPSDFAVAPSNGVPMRNNAFNSSVMVWDVDSKPIKTIRELIPLHKPWEKWVGDQQWLSMMPIRVDLFPSRWIHKYHVVHGPYKPNRATVVTLLIQGGKNKKLIEDGHDWIREYWR
jgi:hypothetical protein